MAKTTEKKRITEKDFYELLNKYKDTIPQNILLSKLMHGVYLADVRKELEEISKKN